MNYQQLLPRQKLLTAWCLRLWIASHFHSHSLSHPLYAEWLGLTWWLKHTKKKHFIYRPGGLYSDFIHGSKQHN